jgi:hypothetical protein
MVKEFYPETRYTLVVRFFSSTEMKFRRLAIRLLIIFGVVAIGFLILFWRIVRVGAVENPPCPACSTIYGSAQIPTVTLCDLIRNSAQYNGRLVRVHALLKQDSDYVSLTDSSLPCASGSFVYSGFQEPFAACDGARKLLTIYTGYDPQGHLYDGVANVVIVGRWGVIKNAGQFDDQTGLSILCLETVTSPGDEDSHRWRYFEFRILFRRF